MRNRKKIISLYIVAFVLASCSIMYELLMAKIMGRLTGNIILWQSITIGLFLFFLGIGTFVAEKIKSGNSILKLLKIEIGLAITGSIGFYIIYLLHLNFKLETSIPYVYFSDFGVYVEKNPAVSFYLFLCTSQLITALLGFLSGMEIPFLLQLNKKLGKSQHENIIIGVNYFGALFGTLLLSFILLPSFHSLYIGCALAITNIFIAVWFYNKIKHRTHKIYFAASFLSVTIILALLFVGQRIINIHTKASYEISFPLPADASNTEILNLLYEKLWVESYKSLYQEIDILGQVSNKSNYTVYIDGNYQFNSLTERSYHEAMSHIPISGMDISLKQVLVLGGGDGLLTRELLKYDEIKKIIQVELDPEMVKLAQEDSLFLKLNKNSLKDNKVQLIIGDAFYYVRNSTKKFDAIFIDFPYPFSYDVQKLYSIEFYKNLKALLKPEGFIVLDIPLITESDKEMDYYKKFNSVFLSTLYFAGYEYMQPYALNTETFVIASVNKQFNSEKVTYNDYFQYLDNKDLEQIFNSEIKYETKSNLVNSIFHPKLLGFSKKSF